MRFWLYPNPTSAEACRLAEQIAAHPGVMTAACPEAADIAVILGGDGTVLRAARLPHAVEKPFWVVNCGHLGYLSDCGPEDAFAGLDKILSSDYHMEYRARIGGTLLPDRRVTALNELLFHRSACVHTLRIEVTVNGSLALRYRGDGLIVCTASGSTAYNLSAGGPVLMPEMDLMALTPICPQSLSAVPIVVSVQDDVTVSWRMETQDGADEWPDLTVDGQEKILLPLTGCLRLSEPPPRIALIRTQDADFYGRLQHRMHWNVE